MIQRKLEWLMYRRVSIELARGIVLGPRVCVGRGQSLTLTPRLHLIDIVVWNTVVSVQKRTLERLLERGLISPETLC